MSIESIPRKIVKKTIRPIAKKVRRVADAAISENEQKYIDKINSLTDIINEQKKINHTLQSNLDNFERNKKYIYYYHGGSGNHGCEALVRTITSICNIKPDDLSLYSFRPNEDRQFGILSISGYIKQSTLSKNDILDKYLPGTIALSIGGDNYCSYPNPKLADCNRAFHKAGAKTALIGCSIDTEIFDHNEVLGDLCQYDLITARESITYNNLLAHGITHNTHLIPDSAFTLPLEPCDIKLPKQTVGLNISSIAENTSGKMFFDNIINLINYILNKTNYTIALIPHVHQDFNDDFTLMRKIYEYFLENQRIILIQPNLNACQIKYVISQCDLLMAARTHCSVAGYSTNIPTLVLGYSVKSKGIAKDIFGTDEGYVLPIQNLKTVNDITESFVWLEKNKTSIRKKLAVVMPKYIAKTAELQSQIQKLKHSNTTTNIPVPTKAKIGQYRKKVLSIITSCFNSEDYLFRYLNSIVDQTDHRIQLVIINDGSLDSTEEIIEKYRSLLESKGVELIHLKQPNGGISEAYNLALQYINGEYFCWCDSDNYYASNFVETVLNYFTNNPEATILRHDGYMVTEEELEKDEATNRNFTLFSQTSHNPYKEDLFMNALLEKNWHFGNIVLQTKAFDKVNGRHIYPSRYGQNWQLCLPMLYHYKASYIPDKLFYFVIRKNSVSHQNLGQSDNTLLFKQFDGYKNILENVIKDMHLENQDYLLELIRQKYIHRKLEIAKETNNKSDITHYTNELKKTIGDHDIYLNEVKALSQ